MKEEEQKDQARPPGRTKDQKEIQVVLLSSSREGNIPAMVEFIPQCSDSLQSAPNISAIFHPPEFVTEL